MKRFGLDGRRDLITARKEFNLLTEEFRLLVTPEQFRTICREAQTRNQSPRDLILSALRNDKVQL
jgi:hypothetical protein